MNTPSVAACRAGWFAGLAAAVVSISVLLTGCAGVTSHPGPPPSHAYTDVAGTRLARIAAANLPAASAAASAPVSGFRLLPEGEHAFDARIALARRAERSIDAQYYQIQNDAIGQRFLRELRDAAQRGVRVRLIVDDLYAAGEDELFAGLAAYPNAEVRIFNPLPSRAGSFKTRLLFSMWDFRRINHRMHNKLFVADNSFVVSGGRNIANEYFMRSESANFIDMDVLSSGPVAHDFSASFDRYWNSPQVVPIGVLAAPVDAATARRRFDESVSQAGDDITPRPADILGATPVADQLDAGHLGQVFAAADVFADSPAKVDDDGSEAATDTVTEKTLAVFATAHESVRITSPYFIPGERGLAMMQRAGAAGGETSLVTNSLGATDEPLVYEAYQRYRLAMLQAGVHIYELSPTLAPRSGQLGSFGRSLGRLHAKVAIIDMRRAFIGSMNLDPRSARTNTELGLVIESPEIAAQLHGLFRSNLASGAYRLRLTPDREHVVWVETDADGQEIVHREEPGSNRLQRLWLRLLSSFVGEDLL
jgi:putative cardiolipin synthase